MTDRDAETPAWKTDLGAYTRKFLKPILSLDEPTTFRVTKLLEALVPHGWAFEELTTWAKWHADRVMADPSLKKPGAVFAKRLDGGSPKEMPVPPKRVNPEGHSPAPDYRRAQQENRELCEEHGRFPPILLIQGRGRVAGDYQQALVDVEAEFERQGRPEYHELDLTPFEEGGSCECAPLPLKDFKDAAAQLRRVAERAEAYAAKKAEPGTERWQDRRVREQAERDKKWGPRRHPYSISEPKNPKETT